MRYKGDGTIDPRRVNYAFAFDAAVAEPAGEFAVIYQRLGTKGLLLKNGRIVREINRSFCHASAYEYPVALVRQGDRVLLVHCPDSYNKLEVEDAASGESLTPRTSPSVDFFHSRLAASPSGRYLLSAGWVWHPWDAVAYYDLEEALRHPGHLDQLEWGAPTSRNTSLAAEASACWLGDGKALLCAGAEPEDAEEADELGEGRLKPCGLAVYDVLGRTIRSACVLDEPAGTMMPVGSTHAITFYKHPRLIRLSDGAVEFSLPWLASGVQLSSIIHHHDAPPPLALDPEHRRFAVAQGEKVHVISIILPDGTF